MQREIARQRSGRGRFKRTLQLVELCVAAGKDAIAQPFSTTLRRPLRPTSWMIGKKGETVAAALAR